MNYKEYIKESIQHLRPAYRLARSCIRDITNMREKPNAFDYIDVGLSWKQNYEDVYGQQDLRLYFLGMKWLAPAIFNGSFSKLIVSMLSTYDSKRVRCLKKTEAAHIYQFDLDNETRFGWVYTPDGGLFGVYLQANKELACQKLAEIFWNQFKTKNIHLTITDTSGGELVALEDTFSDDFIISNRAKEQIETIQKYISEGYGRSILYYGPPGSGKTNLVRGICSALNARTIRFSELSGCNMDFIAEVLVMLNPDSIVLEDIDNLVITDVSDLLNKLEVFNTKNKILLATANQVSKLDNALIRPGRFDQAIEVNKLDEEVIKKIVENDLEIFEIVKDFPVAFIVEFMKRVKVLGKINAIDSIDDLLQRIQNFKQANYSLEIDPSTKPVIFNRFKQKKGYRAVAVEACGPAMSPKYASDRSSGARRDKR